MRKLKQLRLPVPQHPNSAEREYYRNLLAYHKLYRKLLSDELDAVIPELKEHAASVIPDEIRNDALHVRVVRMDANIEKVLRKLFGAVQSRMNVMMPDSLLFKWAVAMAGHVNDISKRNIARFAKTADVEIEPLLNDKGLSPFFKSVVNENVGLIRSISEDDMPRLKKTLVTTITQDKTNSELAAILTKHFDISKSKAQLIATDQVGKLNGKLDQYRQSQIGFKRYRWRGMRDERETGNPGGLYPDAKPSHWDREGKIYSWDNPPAGGHPKERPRCRCYAEPIIEDILK